MLCRADNGRVLGYDNSHDLATGNLWREAGSRSNSNTRAWESRTNRFRHQRASCGGRKMKKIAKNLTLSTGTAEAFFERSLGRASTLVMTDGKLPIVTVSPSRHNPAHLLRVLTAQLIRYSTPCFCTGCRTDVADLAMVPKKAARPVRRDRRILTALGLVRTHEEPNPGHGRRKIVEPLASKYELVASRSDQRKCANERPSIGPKAAWPLFLQARRLIRYVVVSVSRQSVPYREPRMFRRWSGPEGRFLSG